MTSERGSKDDVCVAPKTAESGEECGGARSGGDALSLCDCPKVADQAECSTCAEDRGRSARCQHCPMVFLSADRLASHMSSSHNERQPTSSSARESANTKAAQQDSRPKRRASEKSAPAPKSKVRKVEVTAEPSKPVEVKDCATPAREAKDCATPAREVKDCATPAREAKFRCAQCPKAYLSSSSLRRHSAIHKREASSQAEDKGGESGQAGDSITKTETVDVDQSTDETTETIGTTVEKSEPSCAADLCAPQSGSEEPKKVSKPRKRRRPSKSTTEADDQPALPMDTIVCSVCRETFEDETTFAEHQQQKHGGSHPAGCDICELEWPTPTLLRAHKIANHLCRQRGRPYGQDPFNRWYIQVDGQKHLKCDQCNYNSLWHHKGRFLEHYRIHTGERPFACDQCGKQFRTRSLMHKHVAYVHEGIKEHACDICGRRFSDKRYMEDHRRIHTGERPYVCDLCGKTFKQGASLFIHKELHKGLRKHACDMCGKRFTTSSSLSVHIKRHMGERNFVCAVCGKAFVDGKHLRDHLTVHSEDRPFSCELCGARFKLMKHLKQHGRTHKRDFPG